MNPTLHVAGPTPLDAVDATAEDWLALARRQQQDGWWFEALWGCQEPQPHLLALWGRPGALRLTRLACPDARFPSLTPAVPAADWFERALRDRTGWAPQGHVDPRPFLYHESYPPQYTEGAPLEGDPLARRWDYPFLRHEGPGVLEIPVGPIHAGIIEPGHFRFTTVGEIILDLEVRLNYTHKGTLTLARGKSLEHALRLLERLSGDNAAAHGTAFAAACEAALGLAIPDAVQDLRTAMVELERLYNHFGDLAGIAVDVAYAAGASHFQALREELLRWNGALFGHRLLMNAVAVGGLHRGPSVTAWKEFQAALPLLRRRFERAVHLIVDHSGLKERVEATGILQRSTAELLACVGPAARASGVPRDARHDAPCLGYARLKVRPVTLDRGDVSSRMWVKIKEARASFDLLGGPLAGVVHLPLAAPLPTSSIEGQGVAQVEASRGAVLAWVHVRNGRVVELYQRDPSFLNWRALPQAVRRNIVPDFPLINKSFNLSYSGSDA